MMPVRRTARRPGRARHVLSRGGQRERPVTHNVVNQISSPVMGAGRPCLGERTPSLSARSSCRRQPRRLRDHAASSWRRWSQAALPIGCSCRPPGAARGGVAFWFRLVRQGKKGFTRRAPRKRGGPPRKEPARLREAHFALSVVLRVFSVPSVPPSFFLTTPPHSRGRRWRGAWRTPVVAVIVPRAERLWPRIYGDGSDQHDCAEAEACRLVATALMQCDQRGGTERRRRIR